MDAGSEELGNVVLRMRRGGHGASVKNETNDGAVSILGRRLKGSFQGLRIIIPYS